jgi:hypothetical protein
MSIIDFSPYEARRRAAQGQYGATSARNAYANFLSRTRGQRDLEMVGERYREQAPRFVSGYTQRGLAGPSVSSGIYSKGLQDFAKQAFRDQQNLQEQLNQQQMMADYEQAGLEADYRAALADIEADKAREIAESAATLSSFKPFLS